MQEVLQQGAGIEGEGLSIQIITLIKWMWWKCNHKQKTKAKDSSVLGKMPDISYGCQKEGVKTTRIKGTDQPGKLWLKFSTVQDNLNTAVSGKGKKC